MFLYLGSQREIKKVTDDDQQGAGARTTSGDH
jgi:hypothetical protein